MPESDIPELEVHETVIIEREYDEQGRVTKEKRTVSGPPRKQLREIEPRTPLRGPEERFYQAPNPPSYSQPNWGHSPPQLPYTVVCGSPSPQTSFQA